MCSDTCFLISIACSQCETSGTENIGKQDPGQEKRNILEKRTSQTCEDISQTCEDISQTCEDISQTCEDISRHVKTSPRLVRTSARHVRTSARHVNTSPRLVRTFGDKPRLSLSFQPQAVYA
ncbi:hypothetical protein BsWGS_12676 [Bradybaena similaris]